MNDEELLHLVKKIAQLRKSQCWLCHKLEKSIDDLVMEILRRSNNGMDNNTYCDFVWDDRGAGNQSDTQIWNTD